MSGHSPMDEDRDLDVWVQQVTETWRTPSLRADQLPWQARIGRSGSEVGFRSAVRPGRMSAARVVGSLAAAAVIALVSVMLVNSLPVAPGSGPGGPGRDVSASASLVAGSSSPVTPSPSPVTPSSWPGATAPIPTARVAPLGQGSDELFALTIGADRSRYAADEPIEIATTLRYIGDEPATVSSSGAGLVAFGIEQLDGPVDAGWARNDDCARFDYRPGEVEAIEFQKSGGYSNDDPMADFWREFFADPELRLPAGQYRITARAEYGDPGCGGWQTIEASIVIVVGD
ncbi:MAG: hypothetical protein H0W00_04775 [Chloroflexi bacterium]|nr:hypothetical protein [Chloroflexota bacterium]